MINTERRRDILLLLGLALLCYADKILLGPYAVIDFYDTLEVHFSHFRAMARLWSEFGPFSWYPFHAGGVPSFVGQHPPWHPAVFLSGIMPIWLLALVWNIGQMFLAGYGMYRFLPLLLKVDRRVGLACGALYSLTWVSGNLHMLVPSTFPAIFVWTFDLFRRDSGRLLRLRNAVFILLVSLFSYPVLTLPHFPILHLALVLFLGRHLQDFRRQVAGVFLIWTGYVLLYLPSIASLYLYIPYAQRDWDFRYPGLWPALVDFARWLRGRLSDQPMLALVLFGIPLAGRRSIRICYAFLLVMLLVAGTFTCDLKSLFANTFLVKMDLFMFATAFGIVCTMIAAMAMQIYSTEPRRFHWGVLGAIVAVLPFFGAAHKVLVYVFLLGAGVCTVMILRRLAEPLRPSVLRAVLAGLVICLAGTAMMVRQQNMFTGMFVPYAKGYVGHAALEELGRQAAKHPLRVACLDVHPAIVQSYGLDTVDGKSPLFNKYYKEYVRAVVLPQLPDETQVRLFDELWRQLYLTRNQIDHDQRPIVLAATKPRTAQDFNWDLLRAMNVTHVVSARPVPGLELLAAPVETQRQDESPLLALPGMKELHALPLWIYALKETQGRAYFARPVVLASPSAVLKRLETASAEELRGQAYFAAQDIQDVLTPSSQGLGGAAPGEARLVSWSPDRLVIEGSADGPGAVVVSNNYDPRWKAVRAGGENLPVVRANNAFQAVLLDKPGPFRIELTFSTPLIWWLHVAVALGVLMMFSGVMLPQGAPTAECGQATVLAAPGQLGWSWRQSLLAGLGIAGVWTLTFVLFIMRKQSMPQADTLRYALWQIPAMGVLVALWTTRLVRRLWRP